LTRNPTFPFDGTEKKGRFVGIADSVGDALTYKILTNDSHKILFRSSVRSALKTSETNLRLEPHEGESSTKPINFIKLRRTEDENSYALHTLPGFTPDDLIGRLTLRIMGSVFGHVLPGKFLILTNHMTSDSLLRLMKASMMKSSPTTRF
jgi:hypothetical protein